MKQNPSDARGRVLAGVAIALVVFGLQLAAGPYSGGLTRHQSDEPANYVSGVMAYEYLVQGLPSSPIEFASDYYLHYPAVAIGHWPPMLYAVQAGAYMLAGPSLETALALNGLLTALAGWLFFCLLRPFLPFWTTLTACVLFVAAKDMQQMTARVMAEPLMVLLALLAVCFLCRFVDTERPRALIAFGFWAGLAVLTKAVAWSLAPLPVATVFLLRRFDWFRNKNFWAAHAVLLALCAPWEISMSKAVSAGFVDTRAEPLLARFGAMVANLNLQLGWPITVLGIAGSALVVWRVWRGDSEIRALAPLAVLPATVCGLFLVAPVPASSRYLILLVPSLVALGAVLLHDLSRRFAAGRRAALVAAMGLLLLTAPWLRTYPKIFGGFDEVARLLLSEKYSRHRVSLISSQAGGEVILVAEAARIENPPTHYLLRASKFLASTSWMNAGPYNPHVASVSETSDRVLGPPVSLVILHDDRPGRELKHHQLLREMVESNPDQWTLRETMSVEGIDPGKPGSVQLYELTDFEKYPRGPIQIDMTYTLGRKIGHTPDDH